MRSIFLAMLWIFAVCSHADQSDVDRVADILLKSGIIGRDSGGEVSSEFLYSCLSSREANLYVLECEDVLFPHYISYFSKDGNEKRIVLIIQEGASVENRWVYDVSGPRPNDIKEKVWPIISPEEISELMIRNTKNEKYTPRYIRSVAHSNYRTSYTGKNILTISSGVPDESYGTKIGLIKWNGRKFIFVRNNS